MKLLLGSVLIGLLGTGYWFTRSGTPASLPGLPKKEPVGKSLTGKIPPQTALSPTPRANFTPTPSTRKGYYTLDIVGDFTAPATKAVIFAAAGRNLHVQQDRDKIFRRGFTAVEQARMVPNVEHWMGDNPPPGWRSTLKESQRAWIIYQNYFRDAFGLAWAQNSEMADATTFKTLPGRPFSRNTLFQASMELSGGCVGFGDCPRPLQYSTYGFLILDIENDPISVGKRQEQVNLYTYMMKIMRDNSSPQTLIGSIAPFPHNSVGYSRAEDYTNEVEWLWNTPARQTSNSRQRGMPDDIVGKSFSSYADFQMPGSYYTYPDFDYSAPHTGNGDRHWLAALLGEQEVNMRLSPKKRIAWQWLFNTQSSLPNSAKAEHPAPPIIAEGTGLFYWFTGAYGALLWDDVINLTPDQPSPVDPNLKGLGNDRNYACYEHYVHGLWRLFKHHSDLFDGKETYLNDKTECSYDGGRTWYQYNANQLKTHNVPFVRAIVNGNQILVAATKAYAQPNQNSSVMLRYVQNGYSFYTTINLRGDEIFLGRATMNRGS